MAAERRQYARRRIDRPAYASISGSPRALIVDACERGFALQSHAPLLVRSYVEAKLDLADGDASIVTAARVAWSDSRGGAGIEFLGLSKESRSQLQRWLLDVQVAANRTEKASGHAAPTAHNRAAFHESSADAQLASIAERALLLTHGDGSAIALHDGQSIVCRAAAGELVLPIGSQIDPQSGISGACVRLARVLLCSCADSDPYVDRESCRSLGISSVIAAPIRNASSTVGLIEVFSREPNAFDGSDCYALEKLAEFIAASKSFDDSMSQLHLGAVQRMGAPWHTAEAAPAQSAAPLPAVRPPISSGTMVAGLDKGNTRFIGSRATFWIGVASLLVVGLWLSVGTQVRSSRVAPPMAPANANLAAQNEPPSSALSSMLLVPTITVPPDSAEEERRKAERGDANAQFELGAHYAIGEGKENYARAVKWLTSSAEKGNVLAAATLGAFYWAGRGVSPDYVKAYMWSAIAKAEGDEASAYRVTILRSRLSPTEFTHAELLATAWLRTHRKQPTLKVNARTTH